MSDRWRARALIAGPIVIAAGALIGGGNVDTWTGFLPAALLTHIIDSAAPIGDKGTAVGIIALITALLGSTSTLIGRRRG